MHNESSIDVVSTYHGLTTHDTYMVPRYVPEPGRENHPTIHIKVLDQEDDVDEKIAPLIELLWGRGIKTEFSCQDYGDSGGDPAKKGWMYIQFNPENLSKFLDLVQVPQKEMGLPETSIYPYPFLFWKWEMYPVWDLQMKKTVLMTMAVFPATSMEWIIERCQHG